MEKEYRQSYASPLGTMVMRSDGAALTALRFVDGVFSLPAPADAFLPPVFEETRRWLDLYFSGEAPGFTPPLALSGSPFERTVWSILRAVPYGQTVSYGAVARAVAARLGQPRMAAQAVGRAAGRNPVALIVPCHRVIGASGALTGYAAGLDRKARLLALENAALTADYLP